MTLARRHARIIAILFASVILVGGATSAASEELQSSADATATAERIYERYPSWSEACFEAGLINAPGTRADWERGHLGEQAPPTQYVLWDVDADRSDDVLFGPELDRWLPEGLVLGTPRSHVMLDPWCRWVISLVPADLSIMPPSLDPQGNPRWPRFAVVTAIDDTLESDFVFELYDDEFIWSIDEGPVLTNARTGRIDATSLITGEVVRRWNIPAGYELSDVSADGHTLLLSRVVGDLRASRALQQGWSKPVDLPGSWNASMSPSGNRAATTNCFSTSICDIHFWSHDGQLLRSVRIETPQAIFEVLGWQMRTDDEVTICTNDRLLAVNIDGRVRTIETYSPRIARFDPSPNARRCSTSLVPVPTLGY